MSDRLRRLRCRVPVALLSCACVVGCAGDDGPTTSLDAGLPQSDAARDTAPAVERPAAPDVGADRGVVADCAAIGATSCFGNVDCAAERRCENVGSELEPLACCVPGARGTGAAGAPCDGELDCASAVCVAGSGPALCSKDCASAADCPVGMKRCIPIAMSGSELQWCFPES